MFITLKIFIMKKLKYVFLIVLMIVVAGAIYVATLDNSYDVTRAKVMKAPLEVVFNNVNDYKNWPSWSPWIEQEPSAALTYAEITSGEGASYSWKGEILGEGDIVTTEVRASEFLNQKIKFIKPWESESDIYWKFKSVETGTEVIWGMKGEMSFMEKALLAFSGGMDKQIGPDYERGLFKLDSVLQVNMKKYSIDVNGIATRGGGYYLYNTTSCKMDEMSKKMTEMMPIVTMYIQKNKITMAGPTFTLYHQFDPENNAVIFSCAVPVTEKVVTDKDSGIQTGMLKPFKAVKTTLKGDYENLKETWETAYKYLTDNKLQPLIGTPALEVYLTDPMTTPNPANWVTEIYVPVRE